MDPRLRWLVGLDPRRTRYGGAALAGLLALLGALLLAAGPAPSDGLPLLVVGAPPLAALAYAALNGGPLVALAASQAGVVLLRLHGASPTTVDVSYGLLALPAGLGAFALGAWHAHRAIGGPPPFGEGRLGVGVMAAWMAAVMVLAAMLALPDSALGPRVWGGPEWTPWVRLAALWGPAGIALGWAMARRGPVVAFALATTPLWARYLGEWLGPAPDSAALYLGELFLPAPLDDVRGIAMLGLGVAAMALAMAFEPAWPWMPYRQHAEPGQQV